MKNLKAKSINVTRSYVAVWPQLGKEEIVDTMEIGSKFNGTFCVNNSTICFVDNNEVFVTPYTRRAAMTLMSNGFRREIFFVPFSNGEYPQRMETRWHELLRQAQESYFIDYEEDCVKWCDSHDIGPLSEDDLRRCFRIPIDGVPVEHHGFKDTTRPACNEFSCDCTVVENLGKFCRNNGRLVFVYRDGHTYVAKGNWLVDALREAGYKESGLFVPFSNGERITDPALAAQWESVKK